MLALLLLAQVAIANGDAHRLPAPAQSAAPAPAAPAGPAELTPAGKAVITLHYGDIVVFRPASETGGAAVILAAGDAARERALEPGVLRARLERFGQSETLLEIENTSDAFIDYQAVITLPDGSSQPTSVCTLLSHGRRSFEHWGQPVATVTLFDFRPTTGEAVSCH